jgi:hypothetical protein
LKLLDYFALPGSKRSKEIELLENMEIYLHKKISIEHLIRKMSEIDKLKFLLLKEDEITLFHVLDSFKIYPNNNYIQKLWMKYEFDFYKTEIDHGDLKLNFNSFSDEKKEAFMKLFSKF